MVNYSSNSRLTPIDQSYGFMLNLPLASHQAQLRHAEILPQMHCRKPYMDFDTQVFLTYLRPSPAPRQPFLSALQLVGGYCVF